MPSSAVLLAVVSSVGKRIELRRPRSRADQSPCGPDSSALDLPIKVAPSQRRFLQADGRESWSCYPPCSFTCSHISSWIHRKEHSSLSDGITWEELYQAQGDMRSLPAPNSRCMGGFGDKKGPAGEVNGCVQGPYFQPPFLPFPSKRKYIQLNMSWP